MKGFNVCLQGGLGLTVPPSLSSPFRCSVLSLLASPEFRLNYSGAFLFFLREGLNVMTFETLENCLPVRQGTTCYCWSH